METGASIIPSFMYYMVHPMLAQLVQYLSSRKEIPLVHTFTFSFVCVTYVRYGLITPSEEELIRNAIQAVGCFHVLACLPFVVAVTKVSLKFLLNYFIIFIIIYCDVKMSFFILLLL